MVLKKKLIRFDFILILFVSTALNCQVNYFSSFDGTKIAFDDEGEGSPVLLIHGFINSRVSWDKTVLKKELLANGYRVITPDLRGNGDSDKPQEDKAYANDAEVKDVMLLADELNLNSYGAIGYSRGSIVLAKLLTKDKRIKKAVLGGMGIDFTNPRWGRRLLFTAAFNGNTTEETKGAVDYAKSINADLKSLYLQQKYQPVTLKTELREITVKVLVIAGDQDLDNGNPKDLQVVIPNSKLSIVKGNHNGTYKTIDFSKEIVNFLSN